MYTLRSSDGKERLFRSSTLKQHFHYFNISEDSIVGMNTKVYELPFEDEVISRLEDAIVCEDYPPLGNEDLELIDYLQPIDDINTYMHYSLTYDQGKMVGSVLGDCEVDETDELLFTDSFDSRYVKYLRFVTLFRVKQLPPVDKNLETLYHDLMIAKYGQGDDVEDFISSMDTLVGKWYGRTKDREEVELFKKLILGEAYERIISGTLDDTILHEYVRATCPHLCHERSGDVHLPWHVRIEESDPRSLTVQTIAHGRVPLKKGLKAPSLGYDPEFDR